MKTRNIGILLAIFILVSSAGGCLQTETAAKIDLSKRINELNNNSDTDSLRIAVSAIISPEESLVYYQDLFDYISR